MVRPRYAAQKAIKNDDGTWTVYFGGLDVTLSEDLFEEHFQPYDYEPELFDMLAREWMEWYGRWNGDEPVAAEAIEKAGSIIAYFVWSKSEKDHG